MDCVQHTQMVRLHPRGRFSSGIVVDSSAHRLLRISANESNGGDGDKHGRSTRNSLCDRALYRHGLVRPARLHGCVCRNRKARHRLDRHQHYRYAFTAKRVDRSLYFPSSEIGRSPPLFRLRSVWPQIRLILQFFARRPHAFYLPALILGAMFSGTCAGRKDVSRRVIRRY